MAIRSRYSERTRVPTIIDTPSRTHQEFKDECDVNNIVSNYAKTGFLVDPTTPVSRVPQFGDFTAIPSFQEAQNALIEAQDAFDALPSNVRKRFSNNPAELMSFLEDPANAEEAEKLGLVTITRVSSEDLTKVEVKSEDVPHSST